MKKVLIGLLALVVILVVVVGVILFRVNDIAKAGIQEGGKYALGVDTTVDSVDISLFGGTFAMADLQIANPAGFDAPFLMKNGKFNLALDTGSFWSDTIEVPLIELDGLDLHIIKKGDQNNISPILEHLKQFEGGEKAEEETGTGKKFIIRKLVIKNVKAHLDVPIVGKKTVAVPDIELTDLTQDNAGGLMMSEVMARLFPMITAAALQARGDLIPGDLAGVLQGDLSGVAKNLGGNVATMIENPAKMLENVGGEAGKIIEDATKGLGDGAGKAAEDAKKKVEEGIGDLLNPGGN